MTLLANGPIAVPKQPEIVEDCKQRERDKNDTRTQIRYRKPSEDT